MTFKAKAYVNCVIAVGFGLLLYALPHCETSNLLQFAFYLLFGALASQLKVRLPGVTGTMSVNFLFSLIAATTLNLPQAILVACTANLAQCLWKPKVKPALKQLSFNLANGVISVASSYFAYHSLWLRRLDGSAPMLIFWSCLAYFFVNTVLVSGAIAFTEGKKLTRVWYGSFFWTAPQYLFGGCLTYLNFLALPTLGWQVAVLVLPAVYLVDRSYRLYLSTLEEEQKHVAKVADLHLRTIKALALAIEAKDETTCDHLRRVQVYATEVAKELGLDNSIRQALQAAALLHDIGKLAVPEHILSKPGLLTSEEFEKMKVHSVVGAEILQTVDFPYPVVPIVRHHHEKWDGSGYPDGLKGDEIPIGARILTAVDSLDALASDRPYRRALPLEKAMEAVADKAGVSYDPQIVEILQRRYVELEQKARQIEINYPRLSKHTHIYHGMAPDAGLARSQAIESADGERADFISSIAAARHEIQMLLEITRDLGNSLRIQDTFSLLQIRLQNAIPHDAFAIYLAKDGKVVPEYVYGQDSRLFSSLEIPLGEGLSGWVVDNQKAILNGNPSVEPGYLNDPTKFSQLFSALSVPLLGASGVIGCLTLYHKRADAFNNDHLRLLLAIGPKVGMTIENAMHFQQAQTYAAIDEMTGLPNARSLFVTLDRMLIQAKEGQGRLALLVLDLDGFKQVNDRFGHIEGNRMLKLMAAGLQESCRGSDYVGRIGGDEFVVVLPDITDEALNRRIQELCRMGVDRGRDTAGRPMVSLSIGEAVFPTDGENAEDLLAEADRKMYAMKEIHHRQAAEADYQPATESTFLAR